MLTLIIASCLAAWFGFSGRSKRQNPLIWALVGFASYFLPQYVLGLLVGVILGQTEWRPSDFDAALSFRISITILGIIVGAITAIFVHRYLVRRIQPKKIPKVTVESPKAIHAHRRTLPLVLSLTFPVLAGIVLGVAERCIRSTELSTPAWHRADQIRDTVPPFFLLSMIGFSILAAMWTTSSKHSSYYMGIFGLIFVVASSALWFNFDNCIPNLLIFGIAGIISGHVSSVVIRKVRLKRLQAKFPPGN